MPRAFKADDGDDRMAPPERHRDMLSSRSGHGDRYESTFITSASLLQQQQQQQRIALGSMSGHSNAGVGGESKTSTTAEDSELQELERRLNEEVDEDFFSEPRTFNTLQRVIDVLGLQMVDDATMQQTQELPKNPAYRQLKVQQQIVEGAIEHMAVIHCADLNGSVIQVGRVARQFSEAVSKVRTLRKQVRDIQDTLGAAQQPHDSTSSHKHASSSAPVRPASNAAAMSLRELWLKKLECEATLSLLAKLDIIRAAPGRFDQYLRVPCRIGAAILTLTEALQTMFSDDVAQVQALHKIMEQLMLRKQRAEEVLWDTLHEVIFLRTGNGIVAPPEKETATTKPGTTTTTTGPPNITDVVANAVKKGTAAAASASSSVGGDSRRASSARVTFQSVIVSAPGVQYEAGMVNPFFGQHRRFAVDEDLDGDNASVDSNGSGASLFSLEEDEDSADADGGDALAGSVAGNKKISSNATTKSTGSSDRSSSAGRGGASRLGGRRIMMIPIPIIEAELDLEADERRCLEEVALSGMALSSSVGGGGGASGLRQRQLPRYADPILALRILVECLFQLKRLDDCERILGEGLEREIRRIVQREQARTFARLEKWARVQQTIRGPMKNNANKLDTMREFRRHLIGLLSAFGCVMLRLSHLAEIMRIRIVRWSRKGGDGCASPRTSHWVVSA